MDSHYSFTVVGRNVYAYKITKKVNTMCGQYAAILMVKTGGRDRLKRDGTRAETRFSLSAKWTSPFKSAGKLVQSTTGS
jgi:hypothetical protein